MKSQARTLKQLGQELDEAGKIPLNTYDVLVQLAENKGRLRLRDLVDKVLLSQPGLSRKVARMEEEGLVERLPDPTDGRGVLVRMTRSGRAALRSAAIVHIAGIEREFTSRITDQEAATLAKVFARLQQDDDDQNGDDPEPPLPRRRGARSSTSKKTGGRRSD